jgi:hypothetical protein
MTRDVNILGESIARLEHNIDLLRKQLDPVIRPVPEAASAPAPAPAPQLVKSPRSQMGNSFETFAARVETLIERVQFLQGAVEV